MKTRKELLSSLLKTAQLGQIRIRSVLDIGMRPTLRKTLESQLQEFSSIETEAYNIATQRGWEISDLDPAVRFMADRINRIRVTGNNTDSKIAGIMIRDNTKGLIKSLQDLHQLTGSDDRVQILSQKLLDCANASIRQMHGFL